MRTHFLIGLVAATSPLLSQTNPVPEFPPPSAPWVAPLPKRGEWVWTAVPQQRGAIPQVQPTPALAEGFQYKVEDIVQIRSASWDGIKKDTFVYEGGKSTSNFYYGGRVLVEGRDTRGEEKPALIHQLPTTDYSTFRSPGWLGLDWLSMREFVRVEEYRRTVTPPAAEPEYCYVYRKPPKGHGDFSDAIPEVVAWIRVTDLQPAAVQIGGIRMEFQRLPDPTSQPTMTEAEAAELLELQKQIARMDRLRERNKRLREQ